MCVHIEYAKYKKNKVHYYGEEYEFIFKDEKYHSYNYFVVTPSHLKVLINDTNFTLANLKKHIIEVWFEEENILARIHNSQITKKRRYKKKGLLSKSVAP